MSVITGIVLCGGRSTRMGQDKASLPFGDETLLDRAVRIVSHVADETIVVTRPGHAGGHTVPLGAASPLWALAVRIVHDPIADLGPLAGIAAGLSASHTDLNLIVACDMPLIRPAVMRRLVELRGDADICVAVADGRASPLCAVYRVAVGAVAQDLLASGERRVTALLEQVETKRVDASAFRDLDPQLESFLSCNTPKAYQQALARLRADAAST